MTKQKLEQATSAKELAKVEGQLKLYIFVMIGSM